MSEFYIYDISNYKFNQVLIVKYTHNIQGDNN